MWWNLFIYWIHLLKCGKTIGTNVPLLTCPFEKSRFFIWDKVECGGTARDFNYGIKYLNSQFCAQIYFSMKQLFRA